MAGTIKNAGIVLAISVSRTGRLPMPVCCLNEVRQDAAAVLVHAPEVGLRHGIALVGGLAVPGAGLALVLEHAVAVGVHAPEVVRGRGIALVGERLSILQTLTTLSVRAGLAGVLSGGSTARPRGA